MVERDTVTRAGEGDKMEFVVGPLIGNTLSNSKHAILVV